MVKLPAVTEVDAIGGVEVEFSCLGKVPWSGVRLGYGAALCRREVGGLVDMGSWVGAGWNIVG